MAFYNIAGYEGSFAFDIDHVTSIGKKQGLDPSGNVTYGMKIICGSKLYEPMFATEADRDSIYNQIATLIAVTDLKLILSSIVGVFQVAEQVTGGTSGATADITVVGTGEITVENVVGTFQKGETITGGTSLATATVDDITAAVLTLAG